MSAAARRNGPYAPLSATYADDDAVIEAGEAAELLFVRGLAFLATSNSDGYITKAQLVRSVGAGMRDAAKRAEKLVEVGLWTSVDGGYVCRSWLKWNRSAEELGRARAKDRERKSGRKTDESPPTPPSGLRVDSARNPSGIRTESDGSPTGVHGDSAGIPPSRASARGGAYAGAQTHHITSLQDTPPHGTAGYPRADAREAAAATDPELDRPMALAGIANELVAEYADSFSHTLPRKTRADLHGHVDDLLRQSFTREQVRNALILLHQRPHLGPGTLSSLVHEALSKPATPNGRAPTRPPSAAARRTAAFDALRREIDETEGEGEPEQSSIFPFVIEHGETA